MVIKESIGVKGYYKSPSETCEETHDLTPSGRFKTCGKPATKTVFHERDNKSYAMCDFCAEHNIKNRGGREVK